MYRNLQLRVIQRFYEHAKASLFEQEKIFYYNILDLLRKICQSVNLCGENNTKIVVFNIVNKHCLYILCRLFPI